MKHLQALLIIFLLVACNSPEDVFENGEKIIHFPGTSVIKQSIQYKNGKKNGYFREFYRDGKLKVQQFFVDDAPDDTVFMYHPDGKLKAVHTYKNKLKHGAWRDYNKEGKLYLEIFFKNDLRDSICTEYSYRSLHLVTKIPYKKGIKNGVEEKYHSNGKIKSKEYYHMGEIMKSAEEWDEKGRKLDNDFRIFISENDAVMLEDKLLYKIRLENARPDDRVYKVVKGPDDNVHYKFPLQKEGDAFLCKFDVPKGGFVMEEVEITAYRKTAMGNTVIKTQHFNAASNNF